MRVHGSKTQPQCPKFRRLRRAERKRCFTNKKRQENPSLFFIFCNIVFLFIEIEKSMANFVFIHRLTIDE